MLSRLVRSVRDWFTGDARLRRLLRDANDTVNYYKGQLELERRVARMRTRLAASAPEGCPTCRLLRQRVTFLEDVLAENPQPMATLPPEVPAQPIAENGGEVRP